MAGRRIDNVFLLLLYPLEDPTHSKALEGIEKGLFSSKWEYYYVTHDKDVTEDGELKKPHTHVVLFTHRKMATSTLASSLGIGVNYTSFTNDVQDDLLYLTHNCPKGADKYQYDDTDVHTNSPIDYTTRANKEASRDLSDDEKLEILENIFDTLADNSTRLVFTRDVVKYAREQGIGSYAVRNHQYIDKALMEVNQIISARLQTRRGFEPICDDEEPPFEQG